MNIKIIKGNVNSQAGSKLNGVALDYMADTLTGSRDSKLIEKTLKELWKQKENRFSYQYSYEAQLNGKTIGVVSCYPFSKMKYLGIDTAKLLLKIRKWDLVWYALTHIRDVLSMLTLHEGREGEYHIGTLATSADSRGYGVGTRLIHFVEEIARQEKYKRCSLTVKKENKGAIKLYKKLGYQIVEAIEKKPYYLYRMVKNLYPIALC